MNSTLARCRPRKHGLVLLDGPNIVGCVPGAELVSVEPDGAYKGKILVKLGPLALTFNGIVKIDVTDAEAPKPSFMRRAPIRRGVAMLAPLPKWKLFRQPMVLSCGLKRTCNCPA